MEHFLIWIALGIINLFTLSLYGFDKLRAMRQGWRVPESTLLMTAFFGPFGAALGMIVFRHKIRKPRFTILVPLFAIMQLIGIAYYLDILVL